MSDDDQTYVSPRHTVADLRSGRVDAIEIVEVQFQRWFFDQAHVLLSPRNVLRNESAFAVLLLATTYFEAIAEFINGVESTASTSRSFFQAGIAEVFKSSLGSRSATKPSTLKAIADAIYDEIRCGLFHNALTRGRVRLAWSTDPDRRALALQLGGPPDDPTVLKITVEPEVFLHNIENHFRGYLRDVRMAEPGSDLRVRFEAGFRLRIGMTQRTAQRRKPKKEKP